MNITIGDGVYFKRKGINNFDLYWTVISINGNSLEIEIDEMGAKDCIYIDRNDVLHVEKR
jgi:hypothetical protein